MDCNYTEQYASYPFEVTFTPSREIYAEIIWNLSKINKVLAIVFAAISVEFTGAAIFAPDFFSIFMLRFCVAMSVDYFTAHKRYARRKIKLLKQLYDGELPQVTIRFGARIYGEDRNNTSYFDYAKIKKVYSLKHSYVLLFEARQWVYISRNDFTKGTFEEFKAFLQEKRPDLTIPQ